MKSLLVGLLFIGLFSSSSFAGEELDLTPVKKWLKRMGGTKSLEATFVQQKYLRTLRSPLTTKGHIWIQYPDNFRWELGVPPSTVAIRNQDWLTVMRPKKKHAQRISLALEKDKGGSAVPAAIHSIASTFPRSMAELRVHFDILNIGNDGKVYELTLKPRDKKLTRAMRRMVFFINMEKYFLQGFEIQFRDKSRVRTTFTKLKFNPTIPAQLLKPNLEGYEVSEGS